jgi:hypothetical protein
MARRSEEAASFDAGLIQPESIDKVVSFIPVLSSIPAEAIARWPEAKKKDDGGLVLGGGLEPHYHPSVIALMKAFQENHFIHPFDWPRWQSTAVKIFNEPSRLSKARLETCVKLITLHVRKDRFVGGHFGEMVRCGHIAAILHRLAQLRKSPSQGAGSR